MLQFRHSLPIYNYKQQILKNFDQSQISIVCGETGCGKTTQVPQYLYEQFGFRIAVTQPRRLAAMTIAKRVSEEKNATLGELVGYHVRFDDCTSKQTKIKFMTDGMLIRELIVNPDLNNYNCIIIDEAHERTVQSDLLLALLKRLLKVKKNLKMIVMSATLQIDKFAYYFDTKAILQVSGRTYPIDIYNTRESQADYIESTIHTVLQIHFEQAFPGDILVFLPGQEDIEDVAQGIQQAIFKFNQQPQLVVKQLFASLPPDVQMQAFEKNPQSRKVVLATNIAETSLTIDGIKYVVDTGFVKIRTYQPHKAIETLLVSPISKAQAQQRAGRAGRQEPGKCFRLYTKQTHDDLARFMLPEILRSNLQSVILQMKAIGIKNILKFDFIDKPDMTLVLKNLNQLKTLGALDEDFDLTEHGRQLSVLPLEPQYGNLLIRAKKQGLLDMVLDIVSVMEVENLFYSDKGQSMMQKFKVQGSDHLTKRRIFRSYMEAKNKKSFCKEHFLNQKMLKKAIEIRDQLKQYMETLNQKKMEEEFLNDQNISFEECLAQSMQFNVAVFQGEGYRIKESNELGYIHPESVIKHKANVVIFREVVMTRKVYLRDVTEISNQTFQKFL